jgi:hypothetical protein
MKLSSSVAPASGSLATDSAGWAGTAGDPWVVLAFAMRAIYATMANPRNGKVISGQVWHD